MRAVWRGVVACLLGVWLAAGSASAADVIKIGGLAPLSPPGGVETRQSLRYGMMVAVNDSASPEGPGRRRGCLATAAGCREG